MASQNDIRFIAQNMGRHSSEILSEASAYRRGLVLHEGVLIDEGLRDWLKQKGIALKKAIQIAALVGLGAGAGILGKMGVDMSVEQAQQLRQALQQNEQLSQQIEYMQEYYEEYLQQNDDWQPGADEGDEEPLFGAEDNELEPPIHPFDRSSR